MPLGKAYLVDTGTYYKSLFFIFKPFKATFLNPHLFPLPLVYEVLLSSLHSYTLSYMLIHTKSACRHYTYILYTPSLCLS